MPLRLAFVTRSIYRTPASRVTASSLRNFAQIADIPPIMISRPESPPPLVQANRRRRRQALPAAWMRSGTSKGLFINRRYLPPSQEEWTQWILAAMGSQTGDLRQLDGIGGATSTTSKVAIVAPSNIPGIDIEYTFGQVAIGKTEVDYSGNCGNIATGVGPFALEEGMMTVKPGVKKVDIQILNTNTGRKLVETVVVDEDGYHLEQGNFQMPGVRDTGSEIKVAFEKPGGAMTGMIFPTGNPEDVVTISSPAGDSTDIHVRATLIDVANPFVIIDAATLPLEYTEGSTGWLRMIEQLRREAAVMMGLSKTSEAAASTRGTPKVLLVSPPATKIKHESADIAVVALSMGQLHPSVQLTGAVCLGAAACLGGTVVHRICTQPSTVAARYSSQVSTDCTGSPLLQRTINIAHQNGVMPVEVQWHESGIIERCSVLRTARKLFEGNALFYIKPS